MFKFQNGNKTLDIQKVYFDLRKNGKIHCTCEGLLLEKDSDDNNEEQSKSEQIDTQGDGFGVAESLICALKNSMDMIKDS